MRRREFLLSGTAIACATAAPIVTAQAAPEKRKPNILVIITDEQSAGIASAWMGNKYLNTPNIDSLIASGVTYERAYCANPICVPSRQAMLTGLYPTQSGVVDNSELVSRAATPPTSPVVGRIFRDQGYETAYFGKWHINPSPDQAALHGFHRLTATHNEDASAVAGAVDFLRNKPQTPFLMFASILDPHSICEWARGDHLPLGDLPEPPPADQCPPAPRNLAPQVGEPDIMTTMRKSYHATKQFPVGNFTADKWQQYLWAYYRLVERADRRIGEILTALREAGLDDDTIIIFTADHGDAQGAHGWNQKTVFYEESTRVPFVISQKGGVAGSSKRFVNTGVDLIPTLCDMAHIAAPKALSGISVQKADEETRKFVVVSNKFSQGAPIDGSTPKPEGRMLRSKRYKYCAYSEGENRESLVDLDRDPGETVNLARQKRYAKQLGEHRAMLADWCKQTGDAFSVPTA